MLSDLEFNEKVDVSYFPSISINFDFTNTRLDLIYGSNEFTRTNNAFNDFIEHSENDLNDVNLNMANSFISFVVNQQIFNFKRGKFLIGSGLTYGKVNFFRNLYNSQGFQYEIDNGYYTINNQPVSLDKNFETNVGSDNYYGVNFNSEFNFELDDRLHFIAGFDYVYNLSDNIDLREESFDYNKQNDQFHSIKLGLRYLFSISPPKSSHIDKNEKEESLINYSKDEIQQPLKNPNEFTLNIPESLLSSENDTNFSEDIQNEEIPFSKLNNNCIYFVVDTLDNSSSQKVIFNNKTYHPLYCTESLIDALAYVKLNNVQNSKIINTENDLNSNDYIANNSKSTTIIDTVSTKIVEYQQDSISISIQNSEKLTQFSKTKKMYLDKDVDSLDVIDESTFFVIVGVFSNINNATNYLINKSLDKDNYFKRNNLFYCYAFSSSMKSDAISYKMNNHLESWIYERK